MKKLFSGLFLEIGMGGEGFVEIVDVSSVMLAVVERHGLSIDVGFERVGGIGKGRKGEGSGGNRSALRAGGGR